MSPRDTDKDNDSPSGRDPRRPRPVRATRERFPLWKGLLTAVIAVTLFFGLLEFVFFAAGVRPLFLEEDPFVGFAGNVPLFVERLGPAGETILETAENKQRLFNPQTFPRNKAPGTYRIFCLGGSTTYGRPFDDNVSFPGWLRELLPHADPSRNWEVINCGGISYASYRVANLTKELVRYEPDLFIVYSGHNEFLEERSYRGMKKIPGPVRATAALLSRTRTWAAMGSALRRMGFTPGTETDQRIRLQEEADTMLEHFGPSVYERDDELAQEIRAHYELSLERTQVIADAAGAEVFFVVPASNLKDCSPFKSQHTEGLSDPNQEQSTELLQHAVELAQTSEPNEALALLDEAIALDPRHAELHYQRGKALLALGEHDEAEEAFTHARDEDVCPLRFLSKMRESVERVAAKTGSPLVDFPELLREANRKRTGHPIPGQELFLDHVHPTAEGNRLLALRIVEEMIAQGIVNTNPGWREPAIAAAKQSVEARQDPGKQARGLASLANVLAWAGKIEDASRPARQALETGVEDPDVTVSAAGVLASHYAVLGDLETEMYYRRMALHAAPASPELHFQTGLRLLDLEPPDLELALGHIFHSSVFWNGPHRDEPHRMIAKLMAERGRYAAAMSHLLEAQKIAPRHPETTKLMAEVGRHLGGTREIVPPLIDVQRYESGSPRQIVQVRPGADGNYIPDVIWTEWYEGGELRRFVDYRNGRADGVDVQWDENGSVVSRTRYQ